MHVWRLCLCSFYFNGVLLTGCSDYKHITFKTHSTCGKKTLRMWSVGPIYGLESFSFCIWNKFRSQELNRDCEHHVCEQDKTMEMWGDGGWYHKDRQLLQIHTPLASCRGCSPIWANVLLDASFILLEMRENSREILNVPGISRLAERHDCNRVVNCFYWVIQHVLPADCQDFKWSVYVGGRIYSMTCLDSGGFIHL